MLNFDLSISEPKISKWGFEDLEDAPDKHRWRAWWSTCNGVVTGIELRAYPVIKSNPASVWIDEWADRQATKQPWEEGAPGLEWVAYDDKPVKKRLIYTGSSSAWAKPTQKEAIHSLSVRLTRWAAHLSREVKQAQSAAEVLTKLSPTNGQQAKTALEILK